MNVNIDFLNKNKSQGEMANYIASQERMDPGHHRPFIGKDGRAYVSIYVGNGADPGKIESYQAIPINTNATLRRDEWKSLDAALLAISEKRMGGIEDLISRGLIYNLGNAMGTTVLEWHSQSDAMEADLTMDGVTRTQGDRPNYATNYLPIPIIHVDYEINARELAASRKLGNPLDTTSAERAGRKVSEKLENMLFTDTTYPFGGGTIYSYLNHPDRNLETLAQDWDASGKTGAEIRADVINMKQASINKLHYGPWALYIPTAYETKMDEDYDVSGASLMTIRERLLKIGGITGIKVIDSLTANNVILAQMTSDVVRLVRGMGLTNVQWGVEGNMITKYKVMTIQVPQIRSDQDGNSGIVHLS